MAEKSRRPNSDPAVFKKVTSLLGGDANFDVLFNRLEEEIKGGKEAQWMNIAAELRRIMSAENLLKDPKKIGLAPLIVAPLFTMISGGGTTVVRRRFELLLELRL